MKHLSHEIHANFPRLDDVDLTIYEVIFLCEFRELPIIHDGNLVEWLDKLQNTINNVQKQNPNIKIILILDSWYQQYIDTIPKVEQIVYIDFFLLLVYWRLIVMKESALAQPWTADNKKFLFLTGKPTKVNRVRLLYKLAQVKLLDNGVWSLFHNDNIRIMCQKFLPELSSQEIDNFLTTHEKNPDNVKITMHPNTVHYGGIPYNVDLYNNSLYQIISETYFDTTGYASNFLTEKTWLPIINRRPFIMASSPGALSRLKQMGLRTFENYSIIKNYDNINDTEARLNAIVENARFWLTNIQTYANDVEADVEHNYQQFVQLAQENIDKLTQLIDCYNLDCRIDQVINLVDIIKLLFPPWKDWYSRIKDSAWPDCNNEEDFKNLPLEIQKECIEVFKYKPKNL